MKLFDPQLFQPGAFLPRILFLWLLSMLLVLTIFRPSTASAAVRRISLDDLQLRPTSLAELQPDFVVSRSDAERFALNYVQLHHFLRGTVHSCLCRPVLDARDQLVGYSIIVSDRPECTGKQALLDWVHDQTSFSRMHDQISSSWVKAGADPPPRRFVRDRVMEARIAASREHFFTMTISAWLFRHPIIDGHRGLPRWAIAFDCFPSELSPAISFPRALYLRRGKVDSLGDYAGVSFDLYGFSPRRSERAADVFDPLKKFIQWQMMIRRRYAADPARRLDQHNQLWTGFVPETNHGD